MLELKDEVARRQQIETYLDAGYGSCALRDRRCARIVEDALLHFDGERYGLLAWVVMPNHVHVLVETRDGHSVSKVMHSWKSFTAKEAQKVLGGAGGFWQP
ncbi:MAG: transposase, partial [Pyrinomonadaceae bacterium]